jgi:hypothetical protein
VTQPRPRCTLCDVVVPDGYRRTVILDRVFCRQQCATEWQTREVARLRSWLSKIAGRTRGMGADLATSALYTDTFAEK